MRKKLIVFRKILFLMLSENMLIIREKIIGILNFLNIYSQIRKMFLNSNSRWLKSIRNHLKNKKFYFQFIQKGDLCFDIGANIGKITDILLDIGAKVICVEPQKSCLNKLYESYHNNKNVTIVNKAVGAKEGYGELHICNEIDTMSTLSENFRTKSRFSKDYHWKKKTKVVITTLDNLIQIYGLPKFCKIDVEGYEIDVFKGLSKKIPIICFEFHMELIEGVKECINHLLSLGSIKINFTKGNRKELFLKKWISPKSLFKTFKVLNDDFLWGDLYVKFL